MDNLALRQARIQIIDLINGLPFNIEVKRLLIKEIYEDVRAEANRVIDEESHRIQNTLAKEKEDGEGVQQSELAEQREYPVERYEPEQDGSGY